MKRLAMITLVLVLTAALCGCSRKKEPVPTAPQNNTQPSTAAPTLIPEIDPTLDTNIPDPTVNENSQGMDGMGDMEEESPSSASGTENNDASTDNNQNGSDNATRSRMFQK